MTCRIGFLRAVSALALACALLLVGCGGDDDPASPIDPGGGGPAVLGDPEILTIDADGGTFTLFEGRLVTEWPAGAFADSIEITITPIDPMAKSLDGMLPGTCFAFEPDGMELENGTLYVTIGYDADDLVPGADEYGLRVSRQSGSAWLSQHSYPAPDSDRVRCGLHDLSTVAVVQMTGGEITRSSLDITSAADLAAWPGWRGTAGSLEITADDIDDLGPLANLEWASTLEIVGCAELDTIRLPALRFVGELQIRNNDSLVYIEMPALESVGANLRLYGNQHLASLSFPALTAVGGDHFDTFSIESNPALTGLAGLDSLVEVHGALNLKYNSLETLEGLGALERIHGTLGVNEDQLPTLLGLDSLEEVQELTLWDCDGLLSLTGLNTLSEVAGWMTLDDLPALTGLAGLGGLAGVETLNIRHCDSLLDLQGFGALSVGAVSINYCAGLQSLAGLERAGRIVSLGVRACPSLESLDGFPDVPTLNGLELQDLDSLESISALSSVTWMQRVLISACPNLASLDGLGAVQTIESRLHLNNVNAIPDVDDLSALYTLGGLYIEDCDALENLDGLSALRHFGWTGPVGNQDLVLTANDVLTGITSLNNLQINPGNGLAIPGDVTVADNWSLEAAYVEQMIEAIGGEEVIGGTITIR